MKTCEFHKFKEPNLDQKIRLLMFKWYFPLSILLEPEEYYAFPLLIKWQWQTLKGFQRLFCKVKTQEEEELVIHQWIIEH